jgi:chromosome segregation ATPase
MANAADRELDQAKLEIRRSREEITNMDSIVHQLEMDKMNLAKELNDYKNELETKLNEINSLRSLIDKVQDDKTKLSKKISKLLENERELVQELDSFKSGRRSTSNLARTNSSKSLTTKLDSHIKNIENERDYFKQECDTLQKLLKSAPTDSMLRSLSSTRLKDTTNNHRSISPSSRRALSTNHRSRRDEDAVSPNRLFNSSSQTRCSVCASKLSGSNNKLSNNNMSPSRAKSNDEIMKLRRERDELQKLLDKFEHHMVDVS